MSHVLRMLLACLLAIGPMALASAAAAHTAEQTSFDADGSDLAPGGYVWSPGRAPSGPVEIVVSLSAQRAYVYRNGVRIGMSEASTGKEGHETPTGVFTILEKEKVHRSSRYNDAPMPYMQRLTWYGVALHGGPLPGYAASHGCIRLP
ncbi:MAG TPA: L,D-transpeptidase family protein, partial [Caulobacteraceae bacterium]|nr:L,D-transpeptidase family protein [Caulobacteraceae bacterium]